MDGFVESAKGVVSIIRDGLITLVLIFLIATPGWVNKRLMSAGFVKGNIAGFEWQAAVEDNNAKLTEAAKTIDTLQGQLSTTQAALTASEKSRQELADQVKATMPDSPVAETAAAPPPAPTREIVQENSQVLRNSEFRSKILLDQIQANRELLARVAPPSGK